MSKCYIKFGLSILVPSTIWNVTLGHTPVPNCGEIDHRQPRNFPLQEHCCCGGLTVRGQVGMVSAVAAVGRVLCLLPGSVGHLSNQPQEIWTMGRWVGSHVFILLAVCVLPLSVWLLCVHSVAGLIPMFPFHFSHSSCDRSIWGYRKGLCTGGEYYIIVLLLHELI